MPRIQPLLPFLRPLAAPRSASCQAFCFSTASRLRADGPPGAASRHPAVRHPTAKRLRTTPPTPSTPEAATRAADLAAAEAAIESDNPNPPSPKPVLPSEHTSQTPSAPSSASPKSSRTSEEQETEISAGETKLVLGPAKYHIARSASNNYPVYTDYKRGGNLHTTVVRKITGDVQALRDELRLFLGKQDDQIFVNNLTKQVIVKGHHVPQVTAFLKARGF